ncbi:MAG: DUF4416 family protein [Thermodesulfovibrionales bacterium]
MRKTGPADPASAEPQAALFVGALYGEEAAFSEALSGLTGLFGPALIKTPAAPWEYSGYYREEMGGRLWRRFVFFEKLVGEGALAEIKLAAVALESGLSAGGRRRVNLDPGLLSLSRVVLASTKGYSHRVYLGRGIYAEVPLIFRRGRFEPGVFVYRDYLDQSGLFAEARKAFEGRLKAAAARGDPPTTP